MESGKTISQVPGTIVGAKYRLETPLARGGMGAVWVARHIQLDAPVAVKFMDPSCAASATSRARFEREAKAAASLHNPHVVAVRDYGVEGNIPYLVMELLRGENLSVRLHRERRLSLQTTSRILSQIAKALRRAHEGGLIHRDLKPANIFLARQDDDEEVVKVLDFGIAKDTAAMLTRDATGTGEIMGSPHYMSPEQVRCEKDLDPRADLWSLGVITFRALTGKLPFPGEVLGAVLAKVLADPIPRATEIAPDLPPGIDAFFARVLARDRAQRFSSVKEMADELAALTAAASGRPIEAADPAPASSVPPPPVTDGQTKTLLRPLSAPEARASLLSLSSPDIEPTPGVSPALTSPVTLTGGGGATSTVNMPRRRPLLRSGALLGGLMLVAGLVGFAASRSRQPVRASGAEAAAIASDTPVPAQPPVDPGPIVAPTPTPIVEVGEGDPGPIVAPTPTPIVEVVPAPSNAPVETAAPVPLAPAPTSAPLARPIAAPRAPSAPIAAAPAVAPRPAAPKAPAKPREQHPGIGF